MANTIKVTKDLELPYAFTLEALESFCEEINAPLSDIHYVFSRPIGQFEAAKSLLFHIVKAGFADLGEKMPYTKADIHGWMTGKKVINLMLLNAVVILAYNELTPDLQEDEEAEGETEKN